MNDGAMDPQLRSAYEECRRMHRRHDPTYYWATRRLPRHVRSAVHALYGYVRAADELVDGAARPASAEERLVTKLTPERVQPHPPGMSLDEFAAEEDALAASIHLDKLDGDLPGFDGGTEWINSPELSPKSLKGKVVLVEFWTFMCYNCLNALPHVKDLYAKYRNRGFVVVGVHTPELGPERVPENVRSAVKQLGIAYPVRDRQRQPDLERVSQRVLASGILRGCDRKASLLQLR